MLHASELKVLREGKEPIDAYSPMPLDFAAFGFELPVAEQPEAELPASEA